MGLEGKLARMMVIGGLALSGGCGGEKPTNNFSATSTPEMIGKRRKVFTGVLY